MRRGVVVVAVVMSACSTPAPDIECGGFISCGGDEGCTTLASNCASTGAYDAEDLQQAYGIDPTIDPHVTVAIVTSYGYPDLAADLDDYRKLQGLPACTVATGCLAVVGQDGMTPPPIEPPAQDDWTLETAADLDMVSAACPLCKLVVVEAFDDQGNGMFTANDTAASLGATVIVDAWTTAAGPSDPTEDAFFVHPGVSVFAASGNSQFEAAPNQGYPASSSHVIAVGGTSLQRDSSARGFTETVWTGTESACDDGFTKPAGQPTAGSCTARVTADVSAVADYTPGILAFHDRQTTTIAGTGPATALVAGIFALTGHAGVDPSFVYANASAFHDVTDGNNDPSGTCTSPLCKAGSGWDPPTGVGTPDAAALLTASSSTR
jgi:subtilase family serine protease|nr:S8 family serine peptidase [Kofleriaceae bacterium]